MIDLDDMMMAASPAEPVGQAVYTNTGASLLSTTWTVPAGVTSVCVVAVEPGATVDFQRMSYFATLGYELLCGIAGGSRTGDGGGDGGAAGATGSGGVGSADPGCGGAGGYSGNGGAGGTGGSVPGNGAAGSGGGGGGSAGSATSFRSGGGVGLLGQGSSGSASATRFGNPGSGGIGAQYGGGVAFAPDKERGGHLAWKNNIAVTPGALMRIFISGSPSLTDGAGAVRIMWGGGRSYPYNAGDA